ncbi:MAG: hypothetical protein D6681_08275 [Calditrichaeota bacterium]|nr:MAG: hypothetical protein D6681_08275 [Calditrichota bacterium]
MNQNQIVCKLPVLIILLFLSITFNLFGQFLKIKSSKELSSIEQSEQLISINRQMKALITKKQSDDTIAIIMIKLDTDKQNIIDMVHAEGEVITRLSVDGNYVTYGYRDPTSNRFISKVFNISTGNYIMLEHDIGNAGNPSISPTTGEILYEVREKGEAPKVYLSRGDGTPPKFIAYGIGPTWSPDGKWFILHPVTRKNIHPRERYLRGKITREQMIAEIEETRKKAQRREPLTPPLTIYDHTGETQIELKEIGGLAGEVKWSPHAPKLAFRARDRALSNLGLVIIQLYIKSSTIEGYGMRRISQSGYEPDWSPDGEYLVYTEIKETPDGYNVADKDIYVAKDDGSETQNLTNTLETFEEHPRWISNAKIIFLRENKMVLLELERQ